MAISRDKAAELREQYLLKREELLRGRVDVLSAKLYDTIFNDYLAQLEVNNGKIVNNGKNISMVQGLDLIFYRFSKNENIPVIKNFVSDLKGITPLNEVYFKAATKKTIPPLVTKKVTQTVNKSIGIDDKGKIIFDGFADKVIKDKSVIKSIKKETLKAITQKQGFQQFKDNLKKSIEGETGKPLSGKLQQYYRNFAYDTLHKVDRLNADIFAKELSLIYFYWSGGIIKTTRTICFHANGKIFNANEVSKLTYNSLKIEYRDGITKDWVPLIDLGMHGCRHRKDYVSDEEAAKHRDKWFNINSLTNKPIVSKQPTVLTPAQKKEFKGFPKDESLKGEDSILQNKSIKEFIANKDQLSKDYISRFGNVANTDDARKLFTPIGYNGLNSSAVHEASSALNKEAIKLMLKDSKSNIIEMFAGGAGSGKNSAISLLKPELKNTSAAIIDGNLASYEGAIGKINSYVKSGKVVNVTYVYRDPEDAWENGVIKRMLENKEEMGRTVSLKTFLSNTKGSYDTVKTMIDNGINKIKGVNIDIIDNSLGFGNTAYMDIEKFNSIKYDQALRDRLIKRTKELYDSGRINKAQYEALIVN